MTQSKDDETFTINLDEWSGDITLTYDTMMSTADTFTISDPAVTIDINDYVSDNTFDIGNITFGSVPFVDTMPSLDRVNNMCEEYPALAKAYENFKTIYKMTEQDYKGKLKERGLDDDIPF
jgi:hypothetical protein